MLHAVRQRSWAVRSNACRGLLALLAAWLAVQPAARAQAAAVAERPVAKHALWKVRGESNVIYLLGSIHALTPDYYPLGDVVEEAFERAGTLIEEIDLDEVAGVAAAAIASKGLYRDGATLDGAVTPETYQKLMAYVSGAGLPSEAFARMKPWMAAMTLVSLELMRMGFDVQLGVDRYFFEKAKKAGKPVEGLETLAYQIDRFAEMTPELQEELLGQALEDINGGRARLETVAAAWRSGDVAALERLLLESFKQSPAAYQRLIVERNRNWLPRLETCLREERAPCLVVVGAAHVLGPDGLPALLASKGYVVEQQ